MTEEFSFQFKQEFASEYLRNNKNTHCKNLRCFPICSSPHVEQGFCGCPVIGELTVSRLSKYCIEELTFVGEFQPTDDTFDGMQGSISESYLRNQSIKPHNRYSIARVEEHTQGTNSTSAQVTFAMKPWKYSWRGNRSRLPTYHSFVVTVLAPNKGFGLKVLKQFFSPSFIVSCVRRSPKTLDTLLSNNLPEFLSEQSYRPLLAAAGTSAVYTEDSCTSELTTSSSTDIHEMTVNLEGLCGDYGSEQDEEELSCAPIIVIIPDSSNTTTASAAATALTPPTTPKASTRCPVTPSFVAASRASVPSAVVTPDLASQKYDQVDRVQRPSFLALKMKIDKKRQHCSSPFTLECGRIATHHSIDDESESDDEVREMIRSNTSTSVSAATVCGVTVEGNDDEEDDSFIKLPYKLHRGRGSSYHEEGSDATTSSSAGSIRGRVNASMNAVKEGQLSVDERKQHHIRLIDRLFSGQRDNDKW